LESVAGVAGGYPCGYDVFLFLDTAIGQAFIIWPDFAIQWSHSNLFRLSVLGVPVEEGILK